MFTTVAAAAVADARKLHSFMFAHRHIPRKKEELIEKSTKTHKHSHIQHMCVGMESVGLGLEKTSKKSVCLMC